MAPSRRSQGHEGRERPRATAPHRAIRIPAIGVGHERLSAAGGRNAERVERGLVMPSRVSRACRRENSRVRFRSPSHPASLLNERSFGHQVIWCCLGFRSAWIRPRKHELTKYEAEPSSRSFELTRGRRMMTRQTEALGNLGSWLCAADDEFPRQSTTR